MNLKRLAISFFLSFFLLGFLHSSTFAQQGCCSWHGGISYCDSSVGRYVCNDGTYSPSCGCSYVPKSNPRVLNYYLYNDLCYDFNANTFWFNKEYFSSVEKPKQKLIDIICPVIPSITPVPPVQEESTTPFLFWIGSILFASATGFLIGKKI